MDNKQEQDINFDKLLGSTQEDTKIDFGDSKVSDLDSFMQDEPVMEFSPVVEEKKEEFIDEPDDMDPVADFKDFKLEDLDSALKSFQEARSGKVSPINKNVSKAKEKQVKNVVEEELEQVEDVSVAEPVEEVPVEPVEEVPVEPEEPVVDDVVEAEEIVDSSKDAAVEDVQIEESASHQPMIHMNPLVIEEKDLKLQGISEKSEDILRWYSGRLDDKTYELSVDNMPEFLDTDKTIRVIHVKVASPYGWNVFFDNGIFMNLQDLQIYQTRHGKMPYNSGKIVYGSKSTQFENINRIVVYELPRYFTYRPE